MPRLLLLAVAGRGRQSGRESCGVTAVVSAAHHRAPVGHSHHAGHAAHHAAFESAAAPAACLAEEARARELLHHLPHLDVLLDELVDFRDARPRAARDAPASSRAPYAVVVSLLP